MRPFPRTTLLALWMDERNDFLDTSLNSALQQLASQIVAEMSLR